MSTPISLDPLSYTSFFVKCYSGNECLSTATCFFVKRNDQTFLITNWHVVTGKNNKNNETLDVRGLTPTKLIVPIFKRSEYVERVDFEVPLYIDNKPTWIEHPSLKEKVDVVAIHVKIPDNQDVEYVENMIEKQNEETHANIIDDVYILGFPFGIDEGEGFPIWKRASIASEPVIDLHGLPLIYVDTASRPGMSGSPVIYKKKRPISFGHQNTNGELVIDSSFFMEFVGIYSGRIGNDDEIKAQLGKVWKKRTIDEIVESFFHKN